MRVQRYFIPLIGMLLLSFLIPAQARIVEAEGTAAVVNGALNMAREQAMKDAMRQAMLQTEAHVDSTSVVSTNVLVIESTRVNAAGTVEDVEVLDEWVDNDVMHVRIRAQVPRDKIRKPSPAARYRKKVGVLQFKVTDRRQIHDMPHVEAALPQELLRRLEATDAFIGVDGTDYLLDGDQRPGGRSAMIARLGDRLGVQFLIGGVIRDVGVSRSLLLQKTRRLEMEIAVYDGLSGAKIASHRFSENVADAGLFKRGTTLFANTDFVQTAFGHAMDRMVDRQVEMVRKDLGTLPFSARVIQVKGKKIYFDAGGTSKVKVGDVLMTYRLDPEPMVSDLSDRFLGFEESPVATLNVHRVQPMFAVGELEVERKGTLNPGDVIRFGL